MARAASAPAVAPVVTAEVDWTVVPELPAHDVERALRLGYRPAFIGADGLWHVSMAGSGTLRLALIDNRLLVVLRERAEDGIATIRPVVFNGLELRPVDGRMVELRSSSGEVLVVAADRWLRRLAARLPRTVRGRLGQAIAGHTDTALTAAKELRLKE